MTMQKLGPFELIRVLGRGGMGTVYEAQEADRQEHVAVKALAPTFSFDEHFRRRFEAEIDADWQKSQQYGVTGVPTYVAGGYGVVGAQPYEALEQLMEQVGAQKRS